MNREMCADPSKNGTFTQVLNKIILKPPTGGAGAPRVLPSMVRGFHFLNGVFCDCG